jgi:hypothetical protein
MVSIVFRNDQAGVDTTDEGRRPPGEGRKESPAFSGASVPEECRRENRTCGTKSTSKRLAQALPSRCDGDHKNALFYPRGGLSAGTDPLAREAQKR